MRIAAIIPTYNAAPFIRLAIDSILSQTCGNTEVIVVDDGSTDGTCDIVADFGQDIRLLHQKHGGPGKARNTGARASNSQWIAFLDADDEWLPEKLARQMAAASATDGLVYTDCENVGAIEGVSRYVSDVHELPEGDIFAPLLLANFVTLSSVVIRRSWFEELGGFCEDAALNGAEDWDLWLRCAAQHEVRVVREPLVRYRWHENSLSRDADARYWGHRAAIGRALEHERGRRLSWLYRRRVHAHGAKGAAWNASRCGHPKALRWFVEAAIQYPLDADTWKRIATHLVGL